VSTADLHRDALVVLNDWAAPTPTQDSLRREYVELLRTRADATSRVCFPDHLTAGVIVLSDDLSEVLLNLHAKAGRWFAFGGHLEEYDDSLLDAASREGREESGIDWLQPRPEPVHLSRHPVDFCDPRGRVQHLDVRYAATLPTGTPPAVSDESTQVRWFPITDLPTDEPDMLDLIAAAVAVLG